MIGDTNVEDKSQICALDWLLYDRSQRPEALRQANAIIRQFLITRKLGASKTLFHKVKDKFLKILFLMIGPFSFQIPTDVIDVIIKQIESSTGSTDLPPYMDNRIREYLCYKAFLVRYLVT